MRRKILITVVAVLAGVAGTYLAAPLVFVDPLVGLNRSLSGLSEREVTVGGHRVHYLEGGSGPTVVLLHGIFAEKDHWVEFARGLTDEYHVVAPDVPGFGESSRLDSASYGYPEQVARLHAFLDAIGATEVHLAGNSMGGAIAALYAIEHPERVRTVALVGAPHGVPSPTPSEVDRRKAAGEVPLISRTPAEFESMLDLLFVERPFVPRPILAEASRRALASAGSNVRIWRDHVPYGAVLQQRLPELRRPSLTLWGAGDRVFDVSGVEVMRGLLPGHDVRVMEGVGHLPMMERPAETAGIYAEWLASQR